MKKLFGLFCFLFLFIYQVNAVEEIGINNKFGMHIAVPADEDLQAVSDLVNSNHGKWGYVTMVIPDNDLDLKKWQAVFDKLRHLRLIPIVM